VIVARSDLKVEDDRPKPVKAPNQSARAKLTKAKGRGGRFGSELIDDRKGTRAEGDDQPARNRVLIELQRLTDLG
jgi:hypothetical protein